MMEADPLSVEEYSLAHEARTLRRLIDEATSPALKKELTLALSKVLLQDETRRIRASQLVGREALLQYARCVSTVVSQVLASELSEEAFCRVTDLITARLAQIEPPSNTTNDLKLLK